MFSSANQLYFILVDVDLKQTSSVLFNIKTNTSLSQNADIAASHVDILTWRSINLTSTCNNTLILLQFNFTVFTFRKFADFNVNFEHFCSLTFWQLVPVFHKWVYECS